MNDQTGNKVPQLPQDPRRPEDVRGAGNAPQGMTPYTPAAPVIKPLPFWAGIVWCVAAGACAGLSPLIAPLFAGFGFALLAGNRGARESALASVCLILPAIATSLLFKATGYEDSVFACIAGIVGADLYLRNKLTPGTACMAVAVLGTVLLVSSELVARAMGTSMATLVDGVLASYQEAFGATSMDMRLVFEQMRGIVAAIWPTAFYMIAFGGFVLAQLGAFVAAKRQRIDLGIRVPFTQFDLPLWVVALLIVALVLLAFSRALPAFEGIITMVGGTLLGTLRLAFATQGFACLSWFRSTKHLRGIIGLIITVVAAYLEFNLFVLTIVGILDVWVNFRRLPRGVKVTVQDSTDRS